MLQKDRQYQQQYADIYFLRLTKIKPAVEEVAIAEWEGLSIGNEKARRVDRVLDVRQGELCYVVGTIYVDMPLKPNVMDDVATDVSRPFIEMCFATAGRLLTDCGAAALDRSAHDGAEVLLRRGHQYCVS